MYRRYILIFASLLSFSVASFTLLSINKGEEREKISQQAMIKCMDREYPDRFRCLRDVIDSVLTEKNFEIINNQLLLAVSFTGENGVTICHRISEYLGASNAEILGDRSLKEMSYSCLGGTVHSTFYAVSEGKNAAEIYNLAKGVCEKFSPGKPWIAGWDCRHGAGHSFVNDRTQSTDDLFDWCDKLYTTLEHRSDCGSGVIGGIIEELPNSKDNTISGLSSGDTVSFCNSFRAPYNSNCLQRIGVLAYADGVSSNKLTSLCLENQFECAYGVGFYFGRTDVDGEFSGPEQRYLGCREYSTGDLRRAACLSGLIRAITPDYWLGESDPGICAITDELKSFCDYEQDRMRRRELSIKQIVGKKPFESFDSDIGAWETKKFINYFRNDK